MARPPKPEGKVLRSGPGWALTDGGKAKPTLHLEGQPVGVQAYPRGKVNVAVGIPEDLSEIIQRGMERRD